MSSIASSISLLALRGLGHDPSDAATAVGDNDEFPPRSTSSSNCSKCVLALEAATSPHRVNLSGRFDWSHAGGEAEGKAPALLWHRHVPSPSGFRLIEHTRRIHQR